MNNKTLLFAYLEDTVGVNFCVICRSLHRGVAPMLALGGGGKRRSQLGGQERVPQVRSLPGGF